MIRLTKKQVKEMHLCLLEQTGGIDGVRDEGLLESALEMPFQTFGGAELYPTLTEKAARLGYGLIRNHAMIDGNKRIGAHAMLVFLAVNGVELSYTQEELCTEILSVAVGETEYDEFLQWIRDHKVE